MIITEETLREDPSWILLLMGLPAETFWQLVEAVKTAYPSYEQQRHQRPDRKRGVGGGRKCDLVLVIRVALVLTYLRLHVIQALVAKFFGATQSDVSRDLRCLLRQDQHKFDFAASLYQTLTVVLPGKHIIVDFQTGQVHDQLVENQPPLTWWSAFRNTSANKAWPGAPSPPTARCW